jgi:hypothetical protein
MHINQKKKKKKKKDIEPESTTGHGDAHLCNKQPSICPAI